jgi:hypothetical protein
VRAIGGDWAERCPACGGRGTWTLYRIAKAINEAPRTLARLEAGRVRPATAERLFLKLVRLAALEGKAA